MKIAFLVDELFDEREFIYPYYRFLEEGAHIDIISLDGGQIVSKHGFAIKNSLSINSIKNCNYILLFIPGGYSPDRLRADKKILNFVKNCYEKGVYICAICHGPWVLISANILKGKKATGYRSIKDDIINSGAIFVDEKVIQDENIITATDPSALPKLLKKLTTLFQ